MFSLAGQVHGAANAKLGSFSRKNSWKLVNVVTLESQTVLLVKYKNKNYKLK